MRRGDQGVRGASRATFLRRLRGCKQPSRPASHFRATRPPYYCHTVPLLCQALPHQALLTCRTQHVAPFLPSSHSWRWRSWGPSLRRWGWGVGGRGSNTHVPGPGLPAACPLGFFIKKKPNPKPPTQAQRRAQGFRSGETHPPGLNRRPLDLHMKPCPSPFAVRDPHVPYMLPRSGGTRRCTARRTSPCAPPAAPWTRRCSCCRRRRVSGPCLLAPRDHNDGNKSQKFPIMKVYSR